jgi:hypothetical protein
MSRRFTYKFVKNFCLKRNFELLSKTYTNNQESLNFKCLKCGYLFCNCFTNIKNRGDGCAKCSGVLKHTYEQVKNFLLDKNIELLSKEYKNCKQKLKCKCLKCDCTWETKFTHIKSSNSGCPNCNRPGLTQKKLENILKNIYPKFKHFFNYRRFFWLRNKKNLEIDIWIPNIKLAIEYDGKQHFRTDSWEDIELIKKRDELKNNGDRFER